MAVTVEELQVVVIADVKNAMAQMKQLQKNITKTMADAVKPVKDSTDAVKKATQQTTDAVARANARIAEANARVQAAQDKMRASAAKTQAVIDKAAATSAKSQESLRKTTEAANAALERQKQATERVKQSREDLAAIIDRALMPNVGDMLDNDGPLYPPKTYTDVYAPKKAAQPRQARAPDTKNLSVWNRVTAQLNAKLDYLKQKLHSIGLYGKEAGNKTAKALNGVKEPAEKAAKAVKKVGDSAKTTSRHGYSLGQMLKGMMVSMLFFQVVAGVMNSIKEGMQNMAQGSKTANETLSALASSFLYVKNSIAAAFLPALQALKPVIDTITNALASLMNMIAAVTSRLFGGSSTFVRAKKVQTDYAASLSKTGDAAKKAADDAKGALASFDELNVIGQDSASAGAGTSGTDGVAQPEDMFETVEIPASAMAFADKIAEVFGKIKAAAQPTVEAFERLKTALEPLKTFSATALNDFYNDFLVPVGKWVLGEGLPRFIDAISNGLGKIGWQNINTSLKNLWAALAPFAVNVGEGLLWLWKNVLVPLGTWTMNTIVPNFLNILAAALRIVNAVLEPFKPLGEWLWSSFLLPIAQWTGGAIESILKGIADGLNAIGGWLEDHQTAVQVFGTIIISFAAAWAIVNGAISAVSIVTGVWTTVCGIATGVTAAFGAVVAFLTSPIGIAIAIIGSLIAIGILVARNWEAIKETAVNVWTAIKDFFTQTIPKIISDIVKWFSELPDKIAYAIGFVLGKIVLWAANVITTAKNEVPKIISAVVTFFVELPGKIYNAAVAVKDKVITWASDVKRWFSEELPNVIASIVQFFIDLPQKIYDGIVAIKDKVVDIGKWLLDGIFEGLNKIKEKISGWKDSFVQGFKDALGIHSPSTVMRDQVGVFIAAGIAAGIREKLGLVVSAAKEVATAVQKVFSGISYSPDVDYMEQIKAAEAVGDYEKAAELEKQRNAKIDGEGLSYEKTNQYGEKISDTVDSVSGTLSNSLAEQQESNIQQKDATTKFAVYFEQVLAAFKTANAETQKFRDTVLSAIRLQTTSVLLAVSNAVLSINRRLDILTAAVKEVRINIVNNYYTTGGDKPKLASGGVLTSETAFVGGEYAGASSNPEIVSPQSIMQKTFLDAVWPLIDAVLEGTGDVKRAIEDKDMSLQVDGVNLERSLQKPRQRVGRQRGNSLIVGK